MEEEVQKTIIGLLEGDALQKANATSDIALMFEIKYSPALGDDGRIDWSYYRVLLPKTLIGRVFSSEDEELVLGALVLASSDPAISHNVLAVLGSCESESGLDALLGILKNRLSQLNENDCDQALFSLLRFSEVFGKKFWERADIQVLDGFVRQCKKFSPFKDYLERLKVLEQAIKG